MPIRQAGAGQHRGKAGGLDTEAAQDGEHHADQQDGPADDGLLMKAERTWRRISARSKPLPVAPRLAQAADDPAPRPEQDESRQTISGHPAEDRGLQFGSHLFDMRFRSSNRVVAGSPCGETVAEASVRRAIAFCHVRRPCPPNRGPDRWC